MVSNLIKTRISFTRISRFKFCCDDIGLFPSVSISDFIYTNKRTFET